MSILGGIMRPVTSLAQKTAKAQKVKKISLKVKFGDKQQQAENKKDGN